MFLLKIGIGLIIFLLIVSYFICREKEEYKPNKKGDNENEK